MVGDRRLLQREPLYDVAYTQRAVLRGDQAVDLQPHRLPQSAEHRYEPIPLGSGKRLDTHRVGAAGVRASHSYHAPILRGNIDICQWVLGTSFAGLAQWRQ